MASLFWVGGSTAYDGVTNRLATSSGGAASVAAIAAGDTVTFDANSPAAAAVTTSAAISCTNLTLDTGFTGSLTMSNTLTISSTLTHTQGTLDTNGQTCSWGTYASNNSNTRALSLGASTVTMTSGSGTVWSINSTTGMTFTSGTSTITCSGTSPTVDVGNLTYYNMTFTGAGTVTLSNTAGGTITFNNWTRTGTAAASNITSVTNFTVNGIFAHNGNSNVNTGLFRSSSSTLARTITVNGSVNLTNTIFNGITAAGTAGTWTGTFLGDGGSNTNITTDTPRTLYWVATTGGNWQAVNIWSLTDGGATGPAPPLPQDTAVFTSNSITSASRTITLNGSNYPSLDFTGLTNTPTVNFSTNFSFYGSVFKLISGITIGAGTATITIRTSGALAITSVGKTMPGSVNIAAIAAGVATATLQDDLTLSSSSTLTLTNGTLDANNYNVTAGLFNTSTSNVRALTMGSGTWTVTGTGTVWNIGTFTNLTFGSSTGTLIVNDNSATAKTISLGSGAFQYGNVVIMGGAVTWNTNCTLVNLTIYANSTTMTMSAANTKTLTGNLYVLSGASSVVTFVSGTPGSTWSFSKSSGLVKANYVSLTDATATGGAVFEAIASTNVSGNSGWIFLDSDVQFNNYEFLKVGDGMSIGGDKIR